MAIEITLTLPEELIEDAQYFGQTTQRDTKLVLADTLKIMWPTWHTPSSSRPYHQELSFAPPITNLSNEEVLTLANSKMESSQNERLGQLQAKGKVVGLTEIERYELLLLLQLYQIGQLHKAEALAEAVKRELRKPLQL